MWPSMCTCCGLFAPTQFQFECCGVRDELFHHFPSKVQNLTVFSIIEMIRIRFFGPGELNQKGLGTEQYVSPVILGCF